MAWQREELGRVLAERLTHVTATTSAPWSPPQRTAVRDAALAMLESAGWLGGARARARTLLDQGHPIDEVAAAVSLDPDEIEAIYVAMLAEE
jgi:hypothetical protein